MFSTEGTLISASAVPHCVSRGEGRKRKTGEALHNYSRHRLRRARSCAVVQSRHRLRLLGRASLKIGNTCTCFESRDDTVYAQKQLCRLARFCSYNTAAFLCTVGKWGRARVVVSQWVEMHISVWWSTMVSNCFGFAVSLQVVSVIRYLNACSLT